MKGRAAALDKARLFKRQMTKEDDYNLPRRHQLRKVLSESHSAMISWLPLNLINDTNDGSDRFICV